MFFTGLLPLFVVAHFAHHLLTALLVPLLPMIRDNFALDYAQSALVASAFSISYGIAQLPAGWLADRLGSRRLITISICGVALAGLAVGLSQTYIMMIVFLVLMGIVGGGYHPSAAPLISATVEPQNRGRALGVHLIGGGASFFLAPLIAAAIAVVWGWRGSFIGLAVPTAVLGIIFYMLLGRRADTSRTQQIIIDHHDDTLAPAGYLPRIVVFMILSTCAGAVTSSIVTFIPLSIGFQLLFGGVGVLMLIVGIIAHFLWLQR